MCRSLLVKPSTNHEPRATARMLDPHTENPFSELERQIGHHIDILRNRLQGMPLSFPSGVYDALVPHAEDRSAYPGMYS
jgi:hypothetical protein